MRTPKLRIRLVERHPAPGIGVAGVDFTSAKTRAGTTCDVPPGTAMATNVHLGTNRVSSRQGRGPAYNTYRSRDRAVGS
jgi:hypothetical protein